MKPHQFFTIGAFFLASAFFALVFNFIWPMGIGIFAAGFCFGAAFKIHDDQKAERLSPHWNPENPQL